ncbi:hypothetical protein TNCV_1803191 [Trichonephila clavipes]|uniref:Uncharacterized protein n=1 Tax=Trichonephila clavipes TaxID=2585209 RepID=A0A8X6VMC8_TRICX|nr:hypothetical protein TNCV_1803191 [Trichonephila clavipes]
MGKTLKPDPTLISGLGKLRFPWGDNTIECQCNDLTPEVTSSSSCLPKAVGERTVQAKEGPVRFRKDKCRTSSPHNLQHHCQFSQRGQRLLKNPEESLASRRSPSLEVNIGDIAER